MKKNNFGKYKLQVVGLNLENFLFDISCSGISVWRLKKQNNSLIFFVHGQNYNFVCQVAQKYEQKIYVLKKSGFVELVKKLPYCLGAIFGIVISSYFVMLNAFKITNVKYVLVDHNQTAVSMNKAQIEELDSYLKSLGIERGKKMKVNTKNAENNIIAHFDYVESCVIEKSGSTVVVSMKQAAQKQSQNTDKIISTCDGIVEEVVLLSGKAVVKAGDIVRKGQVLVEKYDSLPAKAEIKIKAWKVGTSFHFENQQTIERTGKVQTLNAIVAFGKRIFGFGKPKFETYEIVESKNLLGNILPIYVMSAKVYETKIVQRQVPFESCKDKVMAEAKQNALKQLSGNYDACTYSVVNEGEITKVDCFLQVTEKIVVR